MSLEAQELFKKCLDECGPGDFGYDVACAECKAERLKWRNPFCICGPCLKKRQDEKEASK